MVFSLSLLKDREAGGYLFSQVFGRTATADTKVYRTFTLDARACWTFDWIWQRKGWVEDHCDCDCALVLVDGWRTDWKKKMG